MPAKTCAALLTVQPSQVSANRPKLLVLWKKPATTSRPHTLKKLAKGDLSITQANAINTQLIALEKSFIDPKGMYYGNWYRSLYASPDPFSGYASWMLPGIQYELDLKSTTRLPEWDTRYAEAIHKLTKGIETTTALLNK